MQTLFRSITLRAKAADDDDDDDEFDDFIPAVLSTDDPVDRGEGFREVLLHSPSAIDLSRAPLPLLTSHDASSTPVGIIENLSTDGRRLRGHIRFGTSARARELHADVKAGVVRHLSIGYSILKHKVEGDTVIGLRWQPHEASAVSVPADIGAGFFRSLRSFPMQDDTDAGGDQSRSQRISARRAAESELAIGATERNRAADIAALAQRHGVSHRVSDWLTSGATREQINAEILETRASRPIRQPTAEELDGAQHRSESRTRSALAAGGPIPPEELRKYSLVRAIRSQLEDHRYKREAGFELEVSRTLADHCDRAPKGLMVPEESYLACASA